MISRETFQVNYGYVHPTCPCLCGAVLARPVEDCVEPHQQEEGGVEGEDCLGAAELPVIDDVEPGAEQQDPAHAVEAGFHDEEGQIDGGEGALLCPVPILILIDKLPYLYQN